MFSLQFLLEEYGFLLFAYLTPEDIRLMLLNDGDSLNHVCYVNAARKG